MVCEESPDSLTVPVATTSANSLSLPHYIGDDVSEFSDLVVSETALEANKSYAHSNDKDAGYNLEMDKLQHKILKYKDAIASAQRTKEGYVNEYLSMADHVTDERQQRRLKELFHKKNFKVAREISGYQKKLELYEARATELRESHLSGNTITSITGHNPKDIVSNVVASIKETSNSLREKWGSVEGGLDEPTVTADKTPSVVPPEGATPAITNAIVPLASTVMPDAGAFIEQEARHNSVSSQSRTSANQRASAGKSNTFGSCKSRESEPLNESKDPSASRPRDTSTRSLPEIMVPDRIPADQETISSADDGFSDTKGGVTRGNTGTVSELVIMEIANQMKSISSSHEELMEAIDAFKSETKSDIERVRDTINEQKESVTRVETLLNDLNEMHNREVSELKQEVTQVEEKLMYRMNDNLLGINDRISSYETKLSKMERSQQYQRLVSVEAIENTTARQMLVRFLNLLLSLVAAILVLLNSASSAVSPFFATRVRAFLTMVVLLMAVMCWRNYDEISLLIRTHYKFHIQSQSSALE